MQKKMLMNKLIMGRFVGFIILFLSVQGHAQESVDGYANLGRGSCQDQRGKMFSYLQRKMTFPNAETCGRQECEQFGNMGSYRGFEYSVAKRCTCLFDVDELPAVPNDESDPKYVSKMDGGNGPVAGASGTPGANCYQFGRNSGVMRGSIGRATFMATLVASTTLFYFFL
ncbi:hypothetical protein ACHAWF_004164 [Thalassiosira exigua]